MCQYTVANELRRREAPHRGHGHGHIIHGLDLSDSGQISAPSVHRAQGQDVVQVVVDVDIDYFAHGHLQVAASRCCTSHVNKSAM